MAKRDAYPDLMGLTILLSVIYDKNAGIIIVISIGIAFVIRFLVLMLDRNVWKERCNREYIDGRILK